MRFAPLSLLLLLAAPADTRPKPAPLPPLVLNATAPQISARIAGQPVTLTVDLGGDPLLQLNPDVAARLPLLREDRGTFRVAVGQTSAAVPFSRELVEIAGRSSDDVRVLTPKTAPEGQRPGSDGTIGLALLPHDIIELRYRAATSADRSTSVAARRGDRSSSIGFAWTLPNDDEIEIELEPLRPTSVASVAAASRIAAVADGRLQGPVRRVMIGYGVARPVRRLVLARPISVAGVRVGEADVRLYDWAGRAELPPDADADDAAVVIGKRGRQRGWPILKLGHDVLSRCASITWRREPDERERGHFTLHCPG